MCVDELREVCRVSLERVETRMDVDQGSDLDQEHVSDKSRNDLRRGEEGMEPPGPACPSEGRVTRSRSGSVSSVRSDKSNKSAALEETRRSRRRDSFETNRHMAVAAEKEQRKEESPAVVVSDDTEDDEGDLRSATGSREPSLKRKIAEGEEVPEATCRKQGRPQTTGEYIGRTQA